MSDLELRRVRSSGLVLVVASMLGALPAEAQLGGRAGTGKFGAGATRVITVPWLGDPAADHQVYSGGTLVLQGVCRLAAGCNIQSASWNPGDGSGPQAIPFGDPYELELAHTYTGPDSTPYVATLSVTDTCGSTVSDTFRVRIVPKTLGSEVNMAIDHGLWNLHKGIVRSMVASVPTGHWPEYYGYSAASTASAVLAFEVSGHLQVGNENEDPYVDDVARGLAHVFTQLASAPIGPQNGNDPDVRVNGIGLQSTGGLPIYVGGQIIDALVASGTPNAIAPLGDATYVLGQAYKDIVQDMLDMYSWGQSDSGSNAGGWRYSWQEGPDNSASQWWAIGGIAAEDHFGATIPQWVKDLNRGTWLVYSQVFNQTNAGDDGKFGYTSSSTTADLNGINTTPSGIVQLEVDGVDQTEPRFVAAVRFMTRNWNTLVGNARIYGMFAMAKAMRLATPQIETIDNGLPDPNHVAIDWYADDTTTGDPVNGVARTLVGLQQSDGSWDGTWVFDNLATAWAIVILSPTIFTLPPIAVCEADPETTGTGFPIEFNGQQSFHLDPERHIVGYEWDFDEDGVTDATGPLVHHAFDELGDFEVRLKVTDDSPRPLSDTDTCIVHIIPPPIPPNSDPGGPYVFCIGTNEPFLLDGTGSSDPDGSIVSYGWDFDPQPLDLDFDDATTAVVNVTAFFTGLGPGMYDVGLKVIDDDNFTNTDFTTVRVFDGDCPAAPTCNTGEPLDLAQEVLFSQLDGSVHDGDGTANGVVLLAGLHVHEYGGVIVDVPSAEFVVNGMVLMEDVAHIDTPSPTPFDVGPSVIIRSCDSIVFRDSAHIKAYGRTQGGEIHLCAGDSIVMQNIGGLEAVPELELPGRRGGRIRLVAAQSVRLLDYHSFATVFAETAGRIEVVACSEDERAIQLDGRLLASGWGAHGVGGEVLVDAREGGMWLPELNHITALGQMANGSIELHAQSAITPVDPPPVAPPATVSIGGPTGEVCPCEEDGLPD